MVDEDNNFKGFIYKDEYMYSMYDKFSEMIMVDVIYKLLDLRMFLCLFQVNDGDVLSEIVRLFILVEEIQLVIEFVVIIFKRGWMLR